MYDVTVSIVVVPLLNVQSGGGGGRERRSTSPRGESGEFTGDTNATILSDRVPTNSDDFRSGRVIIDNSNKPRRERIIFSFRREPERIIFRREPEWIIFRREPERIIFRREPERIIFRREETVNDTVDRIFRGREERTFRAVQRQLKTRVVLSERSDCSERPHNSDEMTERICASKIFGRERKRQF